MNGERKSAVMLDHDELSREIGRQRASGQSIAFANGCFDLLHVGHVRYLIGASSEADLLVVGINSDASVRMIKGADRPLMPALERAEIVASLRGVDYVTLFEEASPARLIAQLRPDVHCKGTDYTPESVPEAAIVHEYGGRVAIVGDPKDHSTTELLARLGAAKA